MASAPLSVVRTYKGTQAQAAKDFQREAAHLASQGYVAISQVWAPGSYGCGSFLVALLLCFVFVGILVFIYMVIVKPPGVLTVTYQRMGAHYAELPQQVAAPTPERRGRELLFLAAVAGAVLFLLWLLNR